MESLKRFEDLVPTDTTAFDEILVSIEELNEEDDEYMQMLLECKKRMIVMWEQPWYQKTGQLTIRLQQVDGQEEFRTGKFTKDESDIVQNNWEKFIKDFEVPDRPICLARWRNRKKRSKVPEEYVRRYVMEFLSRGLKRNIYQVYLYFVSHYGNIHKSTHYSKLEEKVIEICQHHSPQYAVLYSSMILSREKRGIHKKLYGKKANPEQIKPQKWTLTLATKFLKSLIKHSGFSLDELKYKTFPIDVWKNVADDMDRIVPSVQNFWHYKFHVQLFVKCDIKMKKFKEKVLKLLNTYPYKVWKDIRWKNIVKHFPDGMTHHFIYKACVVLVCKFKNYLKAPLNQVIEYGLQKLKKMYKLNNKRLKTLIVNRDDMLEVINYKQIENGSK